MIEVKMFVRVKSEEQAAQLRKILSNPQIVEALSTIQPMTDEEWLVQLRKDK